MLVEAEVAAEELAVPEDLRRARVLLRRHEPGFLEEREVDRGVDIAHATGVAVPIPRATEVGGLLHDPEGLDPALGEVDRREHPGPAATENDDVDLLGDRVTREARIGPGVSIEVVLAEGVVLPEPFVAHALGALGLVPGLHRGKRRRIRAGHEALRGSWP